LVSTSSAFSLLLLGVHTSTTTSLWFSSSPQQPSESQQADDIVPTVLAEGANNILDAPTINEAIQAEKFDELPKILQIYDDRSRLEAYMLLQAALIGITGGAAVALFKEMIEETRHIMYGLDFAYVFLPLWFTGGPTRPGGIFSTWFEGEHSRSR